MAHSSTNEDVNYQTTGTSTRHNRNNLLDNIWKARISYLMLSVFFVPFLIFSVYPILASAYISLTDYSGSPNQEVSFLGLQNFSELLSLELITVPRRVDEDTGEVLFQCGRSRVTADEVAAEIADGNDCGPAFESSRGFLSEGYREWQTIWSSDDSQTIIAARDPRFWTSIWNTVRYVGAVVVANLILGLALALMLQKQSTLNTILRTVFFLPAVTAGVAVTVVWGWIFRGQSYGVINSIRLQMGAEEIIPFLVDPQWMLTIVMLMAVWGGMGYNMILFLAGLQSIPAELYEAATVDGGRTRDKFLYITLPLLRPTIIFLLITGIIGTFQVFDAVYILFAGAGEGMGGTLDAALTVVGYLYERGFRLFQLGYASAIAWILFMVIFVMTLINLRVGRADEAY